MRSTVIPEGMLSKPSAKISQPKWRKKIFKIINEPIPQAFLGIILMLSLFMAESWVLGNAPDSTNDALYAVLLAIFIIFVIEVGTLCVVQDKYLWSFFFWMDVIGTLSIILDIGWIADEFLPSGAMASQGSVIRATRAAKLGARYGRLLRLLRLMKLKYFLPCFDNGADDDFEPTMSAIKKVSQELSNMLSLRTAALTMLLVIVVPFLSYQVTDYSPTAWATNFKVIAKNETTTYYDIENLARKCNNYYHPKDRTLIYLHVESPYNPTFDEHYNTRDVLRENNKIEYDFYYDVSQAELAASSNPYAAQALATGDNTSRPGYIRFEVDIHMDNTVPNQESAMFGILLIVLVIVVLVGFTASYSSAVNTLVVQPLEKMLGTLRSSAMLMINSLKDLETANPEEEAKEKELAAAKQARKDAGEEESDDDDDDLEAAQLEKMVAKLSRIVKHVIPNRSIELDENVDKNTSNWLAQAYSTGKGTKKDVHNTRTVSVDDGPTACVEEITVACKITKDVLNSFDFDVLEFSHNDLSDIITFMFNHLTLLSEFQIPKQVFRQFLNDISGRYINNTYHNYNHGCDVCHTTYRLIMIPQLNVVFTPLEVLALLVGALAHDVGHPGINNLFLVKSKHELALQHNDRSPLENMHCVVLYEILGKKESNIFENLSEQEWREARKIILTIILGTDMSHHFEQISKTQVFLEVHGEDTKAFCTGGKDVIDCMTDDKNRIFIMELILHCSDISNPFKPYALCAKWADLVVEEFCLQGDKEKSMGLEVSPMCDRDAISLCNMQMGFIEFVVAPLIIAFVNILPTLNEIGANMGNNFNEWGLRRLREIEPKEGQAKSEEATKLEERLQKFKDRMSFVNALKGLPQRKRTSFLKK